MTEQELNEIREFTGESSLMPNINKIPFIQFDGKTGMFSKVDGGKDANGKNILTPIGNELIGTIIRVRKQISSAKSSVLKVYSNEFNSYSDVIDIYDRAANNLIATASYSQLQEKYGKEVIKLSEIVYIFFEEKLWRMSVKGTSLNPLWDYLRSFGENDTVLRYATHMTSYANKNDQGDFMVMKFAKGAAIGNVSELWADIKKLQGTFSPSAKQQKKLEKIENNQLSAPEIPTISYDDEEEYSAEKKAIDEIPF
jgi:hypothetical protein